MEKIENTHFDDEIDLFELWDTIVSGWKAIAATVVAVLLLAGVFISVSEPVYESKAIISKPYSSDYSSLKLLPSIAVDNGQVLYSEFRNQLTSDGVVNAISNNKKLNQVFADYYGFTESAQIKDFLNKHLKINFPQTSGKDSSLKRFDETVLTLDFENPQKAATILKFLVTNANELAVDKFIADWQATLDKQLQAEKQKYTLIDENIQAELDNQISRLENEKKLKVSRLLLKINSLLNGAKLSKENRIKQLKEDYKIAKKLNIKEPIEPSKYAILAGKNVAIPSIDLTTDSGLRGYWLGTKIISEEMDKLTQRKDLSAFIPNIVALKQQLIEVEKDPELKLLKERTDNLPYSKKLRDSLANQRSLSQQLTNLGTVKFQTYSYKQWPTEPLKPIKPKSMLILAVASVMGLFLGIFIALIRGAYKKRQIV